MLATLDDKYTFYQDPEKAQQTQDDMQGRTAGIGVYVRLSEGVVQIWKLIPDAPAATAVIQINDVIVAIDGVDVATILAEKASDEAMTSVSGLIRGAAGTTVTLRIGRGDAAPFDVMLTRAEIVIPSVEWRMLNDTVAYIRISEFKGNTPEILATGMRELATQQPRAYVLDVRGNPGGLLDSAQAVLGLFYVGTALWEERATGVQRELLTIAPSDAFTQPSVPVVVLVDGGTASASEVVTGALRDRYPHTTVVGTQSFGKGIVQNIYPLTNGGTVRLTIAQWLTPNKSAIHGVGIMPDIIVNDDANARATVPCVANRQPADGETLCRDPQLATALGLVN
jgi:carboxyl-terminal processing protease